MNQILDINYWIIWNGHKYHCLIYFVVPKKSLKNSFVICWPRHVINQTKANELFKFIPYRLQLLIWNIDLLHSIMLYIYNTKLSWWYLDKIIWKYRTSKLIFAYFIENSIWTNLIDNIMKNTTSKPFFYPLMNEMQPTS